MTPAELIGYYKTRVQAAAALEVTEQTIRNWEKNNKVPRIAQLAAQTLTKGKLKAEQNS